MNVDVNEEIYLEEYNPQWKIYYQKEAAYIQNALIKEVSYNPFFVEHIGSTSIPGMTAKPINDILIGVYNFPPDKQFIDNLTRLGYTFMENASVPKRLYLIKRTKNPSFNVHIVKYKETIWTDDIKFRNYFLQHPKEAKEYSNLKMEILQSGVTTLLEYSALKADFITKILKEL